MFDSESDHSLLRWVVRDLLYALMVSVEIAVGSGFVLFWQVGSSGAFIPLNKWEFAGQIGNLSASLSGGVAQIFVSQPGCSCIRLKALPAVQHQHPVLEINFEAPMYYSPAASRLRNAMMQAHVLAFDGRESGNIYAVCGFDGMFVCVRPARLRLYC